MSASEKKKRQVAIELAEPPPVEASLRAVAYNARTCCGKAAETFALLGTAPLSPQGH